MGHGFLDATPAEIVTRLEAVGSAAAAGPVVARVGDERFGCRNVGLDLPPGRRSTGDRRVLVNRVRNALEAAGVVLAETAIAPRTWGDIVGNVRVKEVATSWGDAAQLSRSSRRP